MKKTVHIFGASWACGEYHLKDNQYTITHAGFETFLSESGFKVVNYAKGGLSNSEIIQSIVKNKDQIKDTDIVFFIQTDPIKDLRPFNTINQHLKQSNGYVDLAKNLLYHTYFILNRFAVEKNIKIYLIGSDCDLQYIHKSKFPNQFSNLIFLVPSLIRLIPDVANLPDAELLLMTSELNIQQIDSDLLNPTLYSKILDEMYQAMTLSNLVYSSSFFANSHPDKGGHQMLFNYINRILLSNFITTND